MSILIKDVDKTLYSRFKSQAVLRGIKVGEALGLAMEKWLEDTANESEEELERVRNNATFRKLYPELIKEHEGKWVVISQGRMIGLYETMMEAARAIKDNDLIGKPNILTQLRSTRRTVTFGLRRRSEG